MSGSFEYYVTEILDGVTDDKNDVHMNSISKFLFYCFNNFRQLFDLLIFAIRHTIVSDDNYVLETLKVKVGCILLKQSSKFQMKMSN